MADKNLGNVIGGYKAALHNPNVSDEAKQRAQAAISELDDQYGDRQQHSSDFNYSDKNASNVLGGHKANLRNPNTSDESKERSRNIVDQYSDHGASVGDDTQDKNVGNVIAGYKAAINNPRVSDEAKEHSRQVLEDLES